MLMVATFRHSAYLELAIQLLEEKGVSKDQLLVAPLQKPGENHISELRLAHQNGKSPVDNVFIVGMIFMLLGAIYGFVLSWGPIIWAMIGLVVGAAIGFIWTYALSKGQWRKSRDTESEVVLLIECDVNQSETIEGILWKHQALGISKVKSYPELHEHFAPE